MSLSLTTLGSAGLTDAATGRVLLAPGKPLALLIFLALAPGRRASRETLIDLLWSDVELDRARNALRQTLFQLRRQLGDDAIVGTAELTLVRPVDIDRDAFLLALESDELERAVQLYRGRFLPAFGVPGGSAFEQWAELEAARLESGFVRGAELLVRRWLNAGRLADGKSLARRVRELLPHIESSGRLVLEAAVASRDFLSAAMEASALEQWANAEQVVLEPATKAAIARARRVESSTHDPSSSISLVAELTGREREFFLITSAWDAVRSGAARLVHLHAAAGLGKSRLLRDAMARLESTGARVIQLRGTPGDRDVPYAFVSDLAAALVSLPGAAGIAPASASTLLALNPALSTRLSGSPDDARGDDALRRRILAMADLVHSVADEQRFVLAIDDLHWIDPSSYRVLEGVWSRVHEARVLCVTASRPEREPSGDSWTRVALPGLTAPQVGALVSGLGVLPNDADWPATLVEGLFAATRGSPLLILETLRHAMDQRMLSLEHGEWRCDEVDRLSELLRAGQALRARVASLPADHLDVLGLLAIAGAAFDRASIATITGIAPDVIGDRVQALERLGLLREGVEGVGIAHDEIADAALATLTPAARDTSERRIAAFFARRRQDAHSLLRAAQHWFTAHDHAALSLVFRDYVRLARTRGDRRAHHALASEMLGAHDDAAARARLVASLPLAWRMGLTSPGRVVTAAALLVGLPAVAGGVWHTRSANVAAAQRLVVVDSSAATHVIYVDPDTWARSSAPVTSAPGVTVVGDAIESARERAPAISADGRSAAWVQASADSSALDIWLRTPAGTRRLTAAAHDDIATAWLPRGAGLLGATARWNTPDGLGYDIAVFDTATGDARPLTSGPAHDGQAMLSPDGTRVAFVRESNELPPQLCVVAVDGAREPECRLVDGQPMGLLVGWTGLDEILLVENGADSRPLVVYDWARNRSREVLGPQVYDARLSPDRQWVAASMRVDGVRGEHDWIVPLDHPAQARRLARDNSGGVRWWEGTADSSLLVDRIAFADSTRTIPLGLGTRMRVRVLTVANTEIPLRAPIRWSSSDPLIADVDSTGEIHPHRQGRVEVSASLVGFWRVRRTIRVEGETPNVVLRESWDARWPERWFAWGDPMPTVVAGPNGVRAFWNRGDGVFPSFGLSQGGWSARQGLGVDVRISSPLTTGMHQRVRVALAAGIDTSALRRADPRGQAPNLGKVESTCTINFPGPGRWGATQFSAVAGVVKQAELGHEGDSMRSGAWWTLRIQILPDGRCGVALNGRVLWVSSEPLALDEVYRVRVGDESLNARLLHGPLEVWTGVKTDIEWSGKR